MWRRQTGIVKAMANSWRAALVFGLTSCLATAVPATELPGCYARTYDAVHLAKNPRQQVVAIKIQISRAANAPAVAAAAITVKIRGNAWEWSTGGDCKPRSEAVICDFLETGGSAIVSRTAEGLRVEMTSALVLDAEGHEKPQGEKTLKTLSRREDRLFLLRVLRKDSLHDFRA